MELVKIKNKKDITVKITKKLTPAMAEGTMDHLNSNISPADPKLHFFCVSIEGQ